MLKTEELHTEYCWYAPALQDFFAPADGGSESLQGSSTAESLLTP